MKINNLYLRKINFFGIFLKGIPPYLAASWFDSNSVSRVTAIAVFGNQASKLIIDE